MDGFLVWKLHRAVHLHLTTLNYDMIACRGQVRGNTQDRYSRQNCKFIFENIARNLKTPNDAVQFCIANIVYSNSDDIFDSVRSWDNYLKWNRDREMSTQLILDDLENFSPDDIVGNPPKLLTDVVSGCCSIYTAVAINQIRPYVDEWIRQDYFTFMRKCIIIKKLDKYIKYNTDKVSMSLAEKIYETN